MSRELSRNQRQLIQQQQLRRQLSGAFDARIARAGETQAFYPLPRGMGAPAQTPGIYPINPGDTSGAAPPQSDPSVIQAPYPGPVPMPVEPMPDFPLDAAIFPTTVPWALSIGNRPFPIRVERWYTHVLELPTRSFTIAQDFLLTELSSYWALQTLGNTNGQDPIHYEINIRINRTNMFSRDVMLQIIPPAWGSLQLPCPYYLPKGTEVFISGGLLDSGVWTWGPTVTTQSQVELCFGGYYVLDPQPAEVIYAASRPMFYVRRFDVTELADETQTLVEPTVRDPRRFELNRLFTQALRNLNTGIANWQLAAADPEDDVFVRLTLGDIFETSNQLVRWSALWGDNDFPRYLSPPVKICSGTALQIEFSQDLGANEVFYNYFLMGGKNIYA